MNEPVRILTIDDEESVRRAIRAFFEDSGFAVWEAGDGLTGLQVFREIRPDVVLVDLRMPEMTGLEVIAALAEEAAEIPVVVLSGTGVLGDAVEAIRTGAWDYVAKPIADMASLEHVVNAVLERARLRAENRLYHEHLEEEVARRTVELNELNARLKAVTGSTQVIAASSDLQEAAHLLLKEFSCKLSARGGSIYLVEENEMVLREALDPGHAPVSMPLPLPPKSSLGKAFATGEPLHIEDITTEQNLHPSGWQGYQDGSFVVFPLIDNEGDPLGSISLHNKNNPPFTEQDREIGSILASYGCEALRAARAVDALRDSEQRYRDLVENLSEVVWSTDTSGHILFINAAVERIVGYRPDEVVGHLFLDFFPESEQFRTAENFRHILLGETIIAEYQILSKSSELQWIRASGRPSFEGSIIVGAQGVITDITARKKAEEQAEKRAGELSLLNSLARMLGADLSREFVVDRALEHIDRAFHPDLSVIFLREGDDLVLLKQFSNTGMVIDEGDNDHHMGECLCGLALGDRKTVYSPDIHADPRCTRDECKTAGINSYVATPLHSGSEIIGVLGMASVKKMSFEEQVPFLEAMANEISGGLRNAILYEKAHDYAQEL